MISVWTQNLWLGGAVLPSLQSGSLEELRGHVDKAYQDVVASSFPSRARRLAEKISEHRPRLIALQEVSRTSIYNSLIGCPLANDYLEILLRALANKGLKYRVASESTNAQLTFPSDSYGPIGLTDRDVILVDNTLDVLDSGKIRFHAQMSMRIGGEEGLDINFDRGYAWADFRQGSKQSFRLINAHLELESQETRKQIHEVRLAVSASPLPVLVTGDFNSGPSVWHRGMQERMGDLWSELHGADPGNTFVTGPGIRCDGMMYDRGAFDPRRMELTGPEDWMSDHAGMLSIMDMKGNLDDRTR